jgi:hypothetical protein
MCISYYISYDEFIQSHETLCCPFCGDDYELTTSLTVAPFLDAIHVSDTCTCYIDFYECNDNRKEN